MPPIFNSRARPPTPSAELVRVLGSLASYNDKGYYWMRHDPDQQAAFRDTQQARLLALVDTLGRPALGEELAGAILSGAAMRDATGDYAELARRQLGLPRR